MELILNDTSQIEELFAPWLPNEEAGSEGYIVGIVTTDGSFTGDMELLRLETDEQGRVVVVGLAFIGDVGEEVDNEPEDNRLEVRSNFEAIEELEVY